MKHVKLVVFVLIGCVLCAGGMARSDESLDRIVTVRATDGLIQIVDAKGRVEKSFGGSVTQNVLGATVRSPNFRVAAGDVLRAGSPQIITAVADQLDPCRRLFDPHSGQSVDLRWSREGRFALDVGVSRSGALTINEKRDADGRPVSSYWNCYNAGANQRLFHTEFGVEVVSIDAGELDSTIAGDEVATINRGGRIEVWDSAKKARDPIVLFRVEARARHVDLTISDVNEQSPGNEIVASDAKGRLRIYSAVGKLLKVVSLDARISRDASGNVAGRAGREVLAVDRESGDVLVVSRHKVISRIKAKSGKPFVDVATIGAIKPLRRKERRWAARFNPVNDIRRGKVGGRTSVDDDAIDRGRPVLLVVPRCWRDVDQADLVALAGRVFTRHRAAHPRHE